MIESHASRLNLDPTSEATAPPANAPASAETAAPAVSGARPWGDALAAQAAELENDRNRERNDRKRERKEMDEHEVRARETILRDFLEVADNLERAAASWKEAGRKNRKSAQDGVDLVLRHFRATLARHSVTALVAQGQPFDPKVHHAVSQAPSHEAPPGTVLHEVQKGYCLDGRLLRPAMVVVASAPAIASETRPAEERRRVGEAAASARGGYRRNRR